MQAKEIFQELGGQSATAKLLGLKSTRDVQESAKTGLIREAWKPKLINIIDNKIVRLETIKKALN